MAEPQNTRKNLEMSSTRPPLWRMNGREKEMSSSILPNNGKDSPNLNCHIAELLMKPRAFSENVQPFIHVQWLFPLFYYRKKLVRFCEKEKFPNFRHPFLFIKCRSIRMNVYESERERVKIFFPNPEKKKQTKANKRHSPQFWFCFAFPPSVSDCVRRVWNTKRWEIYWFPSTHWKKKCFRLIKISIATR